MEVTPSRLLALAACVFFAIAAAGVTLGGILIVPLGLALLAASFVV